jgi:hypothetical protein
MGGNVSLEFDTGAVVNAEGMPLYVSQIRAKMESM